MHLTSQHIELERLFKHKVSAEDCREMNVLGAERDLRDDEASVASD